MLKLEDFIDVKVESEKLIKLVGGWIDIIETRTGKVTHYIDDCGDGDEYWHVVKDGIEIYTTSAQVIADEGDFQD